MPADPSTYCAVCGYAWQVRGCTPAKCATVKIERVAAESFAYVHARENPSLCVCGHASGHHDDEPNGCWDCDCEAWDRAG